MEGLSYAYQSMPNDDSSEVDLPTPIGQVPELTTNEEISVPPNVFSPCSVLVVQLQSIIPTGHSDNFGKDLYHRAIVICGGHLQDFTNCLQSQN